ncbi:flavin-containing monooxygenase 1-like isoform X2 [Anolis sagrei]|uniref:flavin-containing monooxygenase 1-like isoform X2 n=1 Tax=Anolis sagrei TaxID=38937 RepID=UPI00351FB2DF
MPKKVAIVGAGISGLVSLKCCLDEGLEPTCFERSDDIGGIWQFKENVEEGRPSIYKSLISNSCKEMSVFSDFPYPEDFPVFLPNARLLEYLEMYTKHFDLRRHIQFKTKVINIRKCPDFSATGQWDVITETEGEQKSAIFDAVMVCIGFLTYPRMPLSSFPGIEKFNGMYLHSRHYKNAEVFRDKRVLVIGMGNSGVDIAVAATHTAKKVMISTSKGAWALSRVFDNGYPWDMVFLTRFKNIVRNSLPGRITAWLVANRASQWFDHANYGIIPKDRSVMREPVINDELPACILSGKITIRPEVKAFKENAVIFANTPEAEDVDIVVFATGYKASFPFIDESVIKVEDKHASLYKYIFPPQLEKPTLALIGYFRPFGPIVPPVEIQARWVTRVFNGLCKLPPVNIMVKEVNEIKKNKKKWFGTSRNQSIQTDFIEYLDELAVELGSKPKVFPLLLRDPQLAMRIFFGPCSPFQYRLMGPGKWAGARDAIFTQKERIIKPTKTRVVGNSPSYNQFFLLKISGIIVVLATIFLISTN